MKVLIVEDEKISAEHLQKLLQGNDASIQVLDRLDTIEDVVTWFEENPPPDLLFLDINLADGISFEIFDHVDVKCPIIFTTAFDSFAIQAFKVNSIDYLLKPIRQKALSGSLKKYYELKNILSEEETLNNFRMLRSHLSSNKIYKSRFTVRIGNKLKVIEIEDVAYFAADGHYTRMISLDRQYYPINYTLDELEGLIDPIRFFRLNRKFITSINAIGEIHLYFKGRLKVKLSPESGQEVVVSSEKTPLFKKWLER